MFLLRTTSCVVFGVVLNTTQPTNAQTQVSFFAPLRHASRGFYEHIGVGWGFRHQGSNGVLFFNNGGMGATPRFGGFDPNALARLGFGGRTGNLHWSFGIIAGQDSTRSVVSQSPSLVVLQGGSGSISTSVWQPFVTGFVPVVQGRPISPVQERLMRLRNEPKTQQREVAEPQENSTLVMSNRPPRKDDPPLVLKGK